MTFDPTRPPALEAIDIVKRFDGVHALNGARLDVRAGEIHALLGENGAGKSTLVKIITGIHAPDAGQILRDGEPVEFANVRMANRAGIVALYQELSIISTVSVIPMFAMDSATEASDAFALNITTDQQGIVDQTVGAFDDALGGLEGATIMVIGHDPHPGIRLRAGLAEEALIAAGAEIAGGEIQKVTSPATGRTEALALVADYIAANPGKLDGVWVGWDDAALGASKAIDEAGSDAVVTGVDAVSESIAAIEAEGSFLATIEQPWPSILDEVIAAIEAYRADGSLPASNYKAVATVLVTKDNAADITPSDQLG